MPLRHAFMLCLALTACSDAAQTGGEDPNVVLVDTVYFQITGNDGAAFGQFGFGEVTRDGAVFCGLNSPPLLGGAGAPPHTYRGNAPGLYDDLRALVLQHGGPVPASLESTRDRIELDPVDGERIAILPSPAFDGHASDLGLALLGLLNRDGRNCLPFG